MKELEEAIKKVQEGMDTIQRELKKHDREIRSICRVNLEELSMGERIAIAKLVAKVAK